MPLTLDCSCDLLLQQRKSCFSCQTACPETTAGGRFFADHPRILFLSLLESLSRWKGNMNYPFRQSYTARMMQGRALSQLSCHPKTYFNRWQLSPHCTSTAQVSATWGLCCGLELVLEADGAGESMFLGVSKEDVLLVDRHSSSHYSLVKMQLTQRL